MAANVFNSSTNILASLLGLNGQKDFESVVSEVNKYRTITGSRQYKDFLIGFIPPDVPIRHIPVDRKQNKLKDIRFGKQSADVTKAGPGGPGSPINAPEPANVKREGDLTRGQVPGIQPQRPQVTSSMKEITDSFRRAYKQKMGGAEAPEHLVKFFYAQTMAECGGKSTNYNFGNIHVYGGPSTKPGQPIPKEPISFPEPHSRKYYYWGQDTMNGKKETAYGVFYESYETLDQGVYAHFDLIAGAVANAKTIEEYNDGLRKIHYYTADPDQYLRCMKVYTGVKVPPPDPNPPSVESISVDSKDAIGAIMESGVSTERDSDTGTRSSKTVAVTVDAKRMMIAKEQTNELVEQINLIKNTPALAMLINPQSFDRSYEQSADPVKTRSGNVTHMWLEKPMSISCKGATAAQFAINKGGDGGLSHLKRVSSLSYQNLMSLVMIYKNNGVIYFKKSGGHGNEGIPALNMSLFIYYDDTVYIGSFDDFSIDDVATSPHNLSYSFKFTCRYIIEL